MFNGIVAGVVAGATTLLSFDVYLRNDKEKETFHFPVNPIGNITINRSKKYNTVDILDVGEVDLTSKEKKIKEISFSTLLPKQYEESYCRYIDIPNPIGAISKLEKWMEQEEPLRLIITQFNFNGLIIISKLNEEEKPGEIGDKYIDISFRSYRETKIETLNKSNKVATNKKVALKNNRPTTKSNSRLYIVKSGDSLWKIAKWWYGNGAKWNVIYQKNKKVIGSNPNRIYPGQRLVM